MNRLRHIDQAPGATSITVSSPGATLAKGRGSHCRWGHPGSQRGAPQIVQRQEQDPHQGEQAWTVLDLNQRPLACEAIRGWSAGVDDGPHALGPTVTGAEAPRSGAHTRDPLSLAGNSRCLQRTGGDQCLDSPRKRRDAKRAAKAKARRRAAARGRRARITESDLVSFFGSSTVDVSVIRSESGRVYRDGENIPLTD